MVTNLLPNTAGGLAESPTDNPQVMPMQPAAGRSPRKGKVLPLDLLRGAVDELRAMGRRIAVTCGVFDLLHVAQARWLAEAAFSADVLVVAVKSDTSLRTCKEQAPLVAQDERAEMLAALAAVDYVVLFDDPTPDAILRELRPELLVHGASNTELDVAGREIVESSGGRVLITGVAEGMATADWLSRLRDWLQSPAAAPQPTEDGAAETDGSRDDAVAPAQPKNRLLDAPGLTRVGPNGTPNHRHRRRPADERATSNRLILKSFQCPGDIVMLTAAVRDLHLAHPGRFITDVRTSAPALWENNPYLTPLDDCAEDICIVDMHYALINRCNTAPYHFVHGYIQHLEEQLGVRIPVTKFHGDIHLAPVEKQWMSQVEELGYRGDFWIVMAGGKYDFTGKWWNPNSFQKVVDHFRGRIQFVQCGEHDHWHPPLNHVVNLVGKTDLRQFIRLMYHAVGVLCPVTFAMHLAAAVETRPGRPPHRACVVLGGGREPPHWEAYPHHQFLSTVGTLPCCQHGGCWKSRCQPVGDRDPKDDDLCERPVHVTPELRIPMCMEMITPDDVIRRIELYYEGGSLEYLAGAETPSAVP